MVDLFFAFSFQVIKHELLSPVKVKAQANKIFLPAFKEDMQSFFQNAQTQKYLCIMGIHTWYDTTGVVS